MTDSRILPERYHVLEVLRDDEAEFLARAQDSTLHREVMLKAPGPSLLRHLAAVNEVKGVLREARALAQLRHENVIKLLDIVECAGVPLLVLEPVSGESLAERLGDSGTLPAADVLRIGRGIAAALVAVHAAGAVHRGVAPENIFIDSQGVPVLAGFGFSKFVTPSGKMSSILYKDDVRDRADVDPALPLPRYPAPEQMLGQAADARSDLFALGSTLYRALTGEDPFPAQPHEARKHPLPPARRVKGVAAPLNDAIMRCLARSPMQRFQNAAELGQALAVEAAPLRSRSPRVAIAAVAAAAVIGVAFLVSRRSDPAAAAEDAMRSRRLGSVDELDHGAASQAGYQPGYAHSYAVLIGIGSAYADGKQYPGLPNAERDVQAVAEQLRKMTWENWDIKEVVGAAATKDALLNELAALEDVTAANDRVLIYFAGHGERHPDEEKTGWIVPVDGQSRKSAKDANTLISYDQLNEKIRLIKAKHVLLMLDCCFGGKMAHLRSGVSVASSRLLKEKAHLVLTSGSPNERVPDGLDQHSPFLEAFIKALTCDSQWLTASGGLYSRIQEAATLSEGTGPMCSYLEDGGTGDFVFFLKPQ